MIQCAQFIGFIYCMKSCRLLFHMVWQNREHLISSLSNHRGLEVKGKLQNPWSKSCMGYIAF